MPTDDLRTHAEKILPLLTREDDRVRWAVATLLGWNIRTVEARGLLRWCLCDPQGEDFVQSADEVYIGRPDFNYYGVPFATDAVTVFGPGGLEQSMRERGYRLIAGWFPAHANPNNMPKSWAGWCPAGLDDSLRHPAVQWHEVTDDDWPAAWVRAAIHAVGLAGLVYRTEVDAPLPPA